MLEIQHPGLEGEIYQVIEHLISTIGSPQIAIDEASQAKVVLPLPGELAGET